MRPMRSLGFHVATFVVVLLGLRPATIAQQPDKKPSSYSPVIEGKLSDVIARMDAGKSDVMKRQMELLGERYDLSDRPTQGVSMSRGKSIQDGVRVKLPSGTNWEDL